MLGTPEWGGVIYGGKNLAESLKGLLNNEGTSTTDTESIPTMAGCRNTSGLGKVVPLILGKTKYTPSFIGNPFHTISGADGETETFHALYNLGYKDVQVKNVSLDIYDVANNDELVESGNLSINTDSIYNENDYKTKIVLDNTGGYYDFNGQLQWNGGYQQRVVEEERNVELICEETDLDGNTKSLAVPFFSEKYPHRMEVEIQLNGLLQYNDEGEEEETEVEIEIKMSKDGGSTYQSIRNGGFFVNTNTDGNVKFEPSTTSTSNITKIKGKKNKVLRYVCPISFTWEDVKDVKNNRLEFIIQRKNYTPKEKNARNQVYLTRVRTWCYNRKESLAQDKMIVQFPITEKLKNKIKTLSFSISTGKQEAYNVLDKLNVELTSKARIWNSTTKKWSTDYHPTNNIASIVLMLLQHDCRGKKIVSDERIDLKSFGRFYEFCEKKKLYCNGAVSKESKTIDILNELLVIGRGIFVLNGNKYAIAIDDVQENPVMVLNSQNILSISHSKAFEEKIDGYQATFVNALNDYQEDEIIVADADLSDENTTLERVTVNYVTDPAQVQKYLYYKLANRRLRNEKSQIRLSVDGYLIEVGNLVLVQEESLSVGIGQGAEIKRVVTDGEYITGVYVDANFNTTDTSKEYGIEVNITLPDNYNGDRVVTYKLKNLNVVSSYLEFDTPIHLDSAVYPQVGDIISFGIYGNITTKRLCVSKKENGDGTFDLDFIPYQEGVYTADEGEIPEFISNVSSVKETSSASLSTVVPTVTLEELNKRLETVNQTIEDALADIGVDTRIGDITSADAILEEHQIQIKLNIDYDNFVGNIKDFIYELSMDNGVTFNEIKRVNSDIYNYPLPSIHRYKEKDYFANWKLRVKAQSQYDTYSENWFEFDIDTSNYGTWIPPQFDYDQVIAIANEQGINVNLNNKFPSDVKLYGSYNTIVEFSRDGEEWIEVKDNYIPFDRNIDGYPEKEQVEQYKIRVHRKSYLVDHPLMYTEKYVDATGYGTWVPPVFAVNQIDAVAMEQGISVSLDNRLPNNTKYYGSYSTIIEYTRDGVNWNVADGEFIYFDRDVDGYPEKSQLENYKIRVTRKSLVIDHELIYTEQYIDTSSYSTWLPLVPTLRTSISGRTININIEQPVRNDGLRPYGVIKYKVQVKRITPVEDDKYNCPSLSLNPYDSEDNYKDVNSAKDYVLVDNNHRQTMPLSGQNATEPLPVDTMYRFKITAINLVTNVEAEPLETPNLTALATSVKDIVAGAITTTKLADGCVTVDKIAVDTLVADESFMNELTSNVVNAGKLTFEVMNVKDFGFIAGNDEIFTYKYTGNDNIEHSYIPEKGELFFGSGDPDDESRNYIKLKNETNKNNASSRNLYIEAETVKARNVEVKYDFLVKSGVIYNNVLNFFKFTDKGFEGVMKYFNISTHGFQIKDCKEEDGYILNIQPRSLVNDRKFHDIFIDDSNIIISGENYGISTPEFFTITKGINGNRTFNLYSPTIPNPTLSGENILIPSTTKINSIDSTTLLQHHSIKSGNPHNVTAGDLGITVINNTKDADKSVKHAETAQEANSALSAKTALIADFAAEAETDINGRALTSYTKSLSLATNIVTQSGTTTYKHLNLLLKKKDGNSTTTNMSDVNILQSAYSSSSGYVKFANGLIIQWKKNSSSIGTDENQTISLPIEFSNANYIVIATTENPTNKRDHIGIRIYSKAYNQFIARTWRGEGYSDGTRYISFIAIGY